MRSTLKGVSSPCISQDTNTNASCFYGIFQMPLEKKTLVGSIRGDFAIFMCEICEPAVLPNESYLHTILA